MRVLLGAAWIEHAIGERVFPGRYRRELRSRVASLIEKWASQMNIAASAWGIKRIKTNWGSCNVEAGRIWLNLELIKKPPQCLEFIVDRRCASFFLLCCCGETRRLDFGM